MRGWRGGVRGVRVAGCEGWRGGAHLLQLVTCTSSACVRECRGGQHCTHLNVAVSSWVIQSDVDTETTAVPDLRGCETEIVRLQW